MKIAYIIIALLVTSFMTLTSQACPHVKAMCINTSSKEAKKESCKNPVYLSHNGKYFPTKYDWRDAQCKLKHTSCDNLTNLCNIKYPSFCDGQCVVQLHRHNAFMSYEKCHEICGHGGPPLGLAPPKEDVKMAQDISNKLIVGISSRALFV